MAITTPGELCMSQMMKMRRKVRRVRKIRRAGKVKKVAVVPIGLRAGMGGTVYTRVSSISSGSYHLCLGEISLTWHHIRAQEEGKSGGGELLFWEAEGGEAVCLLPMHTSVGQTAKAEELLKLRAQE